MAVHQVRDTGVRPQALGRQALLRGPRETVRRLCAVQSQGRGVRPTVGGRRTRAWQPVVSAVPALQGSPDHVHVPRRFVASGDRGRGSQPPGDRRPVQKLHTDRMVPVRVPVGVARGP